MTEAYSWVITATVGGAAGGTALAGTIVESHSWREAVFVGAVVTFAGALLALSRRATLIRASTAFSAVTHAVSNCVPAWASARPARPRC